MACPLTCDDRRPEWHQATITTCLLEQERWIRAWPMGTTSSRETPRPAIPHRSRTGGDLCRHQTVVPIPDRHPIRPVLLPASTREQRPRRTRHMAPGRRHRDYTRDRPLGLRPLLEMTLIAHSLWPACLGRICTIRRRPPLARRRLPTSGGCQRTKHQHRGRLHKEGWFRSAKTTGPCR